MKRQELKIRPCADSRFHLALVDSKLTPGKKVWKLKLGAGFRTSGAEKTTQ